MGTASIIFWIIVAFFCWRGYQKGFIKSISRLLSWIIAYPCAIFFTKPVAKLLIQNTPLDGLIAYFVAGSGIFLLVSTLVVVLLKGVAKLIPDSDAIATGSKIGGASIGLLMGALIGLLVVYGISISKQPAKDMLVDKHNTQQSETTPAQSNYASGEQGAAPVPYMRDLAKARESFIEASAKKLISSAAASAVDIALDDPTSTQITKAFVANPQTMLTHVQQASNNGKIKTLFENEEVRSLLTTGDVPRLMQHREFQNAMNDPDIQALLASAESPAANNNPGRDAAEKMVTAWRRVDSIKHDPRVIAIIQDPEFQAQLNSPNKLPLMMNPKLNQLSELIFNPDTTAANGMGHYQVNDLDTENSSVTSDNKSDEKKPPTQIYRWTDEDGRVHFSDKPKR